MGSRDRITVPEDRSHLVRDTVREFAAADSDIRPVIALSAVQWLVVTYDRLRSLPLDERAGFVVSRIDGKCTVEMLLDVCGMPEDETLDILREQAGLGAIELRG